MSEVPSADKATLLFLVINNSLISLLTRQILYTIFRQNDTLHSAATSPSITLNNRDRMEQALKNKQVALIIPKLN